MLLLLLLGHLDLHHLLWCQLHLLLHLRVLGHLVLLLSNHLLLDLLLSLLNSHLLEHLLLPDLVKVASFKIGSLLL